MKIILNILILLAGSVSFKAQTEAFKVPPESMLAVLRQGDSLHYYQGHVAPGNQSTITDKFVLTREGNHFLVTQYTSTLQVFPNHRFSGLKIREKAYWGFEKKGTRRLTDHELQLLAALEKSGREAIEYDYPLTRYNRNQLIIKQRKNFKQLVISQSWLIREILAL